MRSYISLLILFFFTSCAVFQPKDFSWKEQILKWQNFKLEGLIEINYNSFSIRKNIVLEKSGNEGRMVVFDSGIFGLSAEPLISATYYDGKFNIQNIPPEAVGAIPTQEIKLLFNLNQIVQKAEFFQNTNTVFYKDYKLIFLKSKLSSIHQKTEKIDFTYHANTPVKIDFKENEKIRATIIIDKIEFR
ncbi:MAG: hypothetical protein SVM86_07225 [Candidatus Cloacimonadota bacterium]|nr:hypothetical protein [Candidatus Cloacimonadota bacterium]